MICHKFVDPGHGWLKVKRETLRRLNLLPKISPYSYQRGDDVFLEEDGDMDLLWGALKAKGEDLTWRTHHADRRSKIRSYASFCLRPGDCV